MQARLLAENRRLAEKHKQSMNDICALVRGACWLVLTSDLFQSESSSEILLRVQSQLRESEAQASQHIAFFVIEFELSDENILLSAANTVPS